MNKYIIITLLSIWSITSNAQQIQGYIYDLVTSQPLTNAQIKNTRTNQTIHSDRNGSFKIDGVINDFLAVQIVGYIPDTIFYYDDAVRRIYLNKDENIFQIDEVLVKRFTDNTLAKELEKAKNLGKYIEIPKKQGGVKISPSRLFGKESKHARSNIEILQTEFDARKIDRRFTKRLIASLLPISDEQIALFRERFRPTIEFIENTSDEELKLYIIESYTTFKK